MLWFDRNGTYNATANEDNFKNYTPARRDTTMLYRYATSGQPEHTAGWRAWRIRVTEEDVGAWMMHCHILQHMIMGEASPIAQNLSPLTYYFRHANGLGVRKYELDPSKVPHATVREWIFELRWQCIRKQYVRSTCGFVPNHLRIVGFQFKYELQFQRFPSVSGNVDGLQLNMDVDSKK